MVVIICMKKKIISWTKICWNSQKKNYFYKISDSTVLNYYWLYNLHSYIIYCWIQNNSFIILDGNMLLHNYITIIWETIFRFYWYIIIILICFLGFISISWCVYWDTTSQCTSCNNFFISEVFFVESYLS